MIVPCIDLKGGKVVQLIRGSEPALEFDDVDEFLDRFSAFPMIHVIDLDAATGDGLNLQIVRRLAGLRKCRAGGGVRSLRRAKELVAAGAEQVIVGTAAFNEHGPNEPFLRALADELGPEKLCIALDSKCGRVAIQGWRHLLPFGVEEVMPRFEPYCGSFLCTHVDAEGTMTGGDIDWHKRLRRLTTRTLIAAGGIAELLEVRALRDLGVDVALGMAIYTGRLPLDKLVELASTPVRPHVRRLEKYEASEAKPGAIRLDGNENPLGTSPKALEAAQEALAGLHRYPEALPRLKAKLADRLGLEPVNIAIGNGSDELIHLIGLALLEVGDEVILSQPTFARYKATAELGRATIHWVPLDSEYRYNLDAMASKISPCTKLVLLANPNSPSGTLLARNEFDAFMARLPSGAVVVLDEAYMEFAKGSKTPRAIEFQGSGTPQDGPSVVGLRTFSKAYGLAGLRVGYAFGPAWLTDAIDRLREPYSVNSVAVAAAAAALDDPEHLERSVDVAVTGRKRLSEFLKARDAMVYESFGNFVLADLGSNASAIFNALDDAGVCVRRLGPSLARISIGIESELDAFEQAWPGAASD